MRNYKPVKRINSINIKTFKKRYAAMLRIKSDSLMGRILPGGEYGKLFNCTCFSNQDVEEIGKMDIITVENVCDHINKTNEAARLAAEKFKAKKAKKEEFENKFREAQEVASQIGYKLVPIND